MSALVYLYSIINVSLVMIIIFMMARSFQLFLFGRGKGVLENKKDICHAFFLGLRFDLKVIALINALPILLSFVVLAIHSQTIFMVSLHCLFIYYLVMILLCTLILAIDTGYYSYFDDHINYMIFGFFDDDTKALLKTIWSDYPVVKITAGILLYSLSIFYVLRFIFIHQYTSIIYHTGFSLVFSLGLVIVTFLLARGTLGSLPLGIMHAAFCKNNFLNKFSLNGVVCLLKVLKQRKDYLRGNMSLAKKYGFQDRLNDAVELVKRKTVSLNDLSIKKSFTDETVKNDTVKNNPPHVVIVMMESLASHILSLQDSQLDLLGRLKKHFNEDYLFENFLSDGQGTIESFLALSCTIPHRANSNNMTESTLLNKCIDSSPANLFKKAGYETSVVYGGSLTWRNLGTFLENQNFDHVEGDGHIKAVIPLGSKSYDHCWGVHDEYLYQYLEHKLDKAEKPQFIIALTTSNHPPFDYPETYHTKNTEISSALRKRMLCKEDVMKKRLEVFQYGSDMAGQFLDNIKSSQYKDNTIVALTGDHSFWGMYSYSDTEIFQKQAVPFYLYIPEMYQPTTYDPLTFGSHKDILPTIYSLALSEVDYVSFGDNLFQDDVVHYAFNSSELIASKEGVVTLESAPIFYQWVGNELKLSEMNNQAKCMMEFYKAKMSLVDEYLRGY